MRLKSTQMVSQRDPNRLAACFVLCLTFIAPSFRLSGSVSGPCPPIGSSEVPLNLTVEYGGEQFPIDFEDLVSNRMETEDKKLICSYIISATDGIPVIGASFLKNVFSAFRFDPPSIGLAHLSKAFLKEEPKDFVNTKNTMTDGPAAIQTISGNWGRKKPISSPTVSPSAFQKGEPIRLSGSDLIQSTSLLLSLTPTAVADGSAVKTQATPTSSLTGSSSQAALNTASITTSPSTRTLSTLIPTSSASKEKGDKKKNPTGSALSLDSLADLDPKNLSAEVVQELQRLLSLVPNLG